MVAGLRDPLVGARHHNKQMQKQQPSLEQKGGCLSLENLQLILALSISFNVLWWPPRGAHLLDPVRHGAWVEWFNLFDPLCLSGICGAQPNAARPQRGLFPWHSYTQLNKHSLDDTQHSHLRYWSPQKPSIYTWRQNASPRFSRIESSSDVVWEAKAAKATAKTGAGCDSKQGSHDLIGILFSDVCLSCDTPLLALLNMIMDMDNYIWIHLILDTNTITVVFPVFLQCILKDALIRISFHINDQSQTDQLLQAKSTNLQRLQQETGVLAVKRLNQVFSASLWYCSLWWTRIDHGPA